MNSLYNESDEIRTLLGNDESALGQVYQAWHESGDNKTLQEISEQATIPYGTVAAKYQIIKQLLQIGDPPSTTTQCRSIANEIRRFKNRTTLDISAIVSSQIDAIVEKLVVKSTDPRLIAKEKQENKLKANALIQSSGIYVYTYPHYRMHPAVESTDDTAERYHLKVGKTGVNANQRIKEQTTGMPEDPVPLLLIIVSGGSNVSIDDVEKKVHEHLEIIGHSKISRKGGGTEWFLSNKESIISIANLMGLDIQDPDDQPRTENP